MEAGRPYATDWIGRDEIVRGWILRKPWQKGGWDFSWEILTITGDTAAIRGIGVYRELGTFENLWTVTFNTPGRCTMFRRWNNEVIDRARPPGVWPAGGVRVRGELLDMAAADVTVPVVGSVR